MDPEYDPDAPCPRCGQPAPPWVDDEDGDDDPLEDAYGYTRADLLFGGNW